MNESAYRINNEIAEAHNFTEEIPPIKKESAVHLVAVNEDQENKKLFEELVKLIYSKDEEKRIVGILENNYGINGGKDDINIKNAVEFVVGKTIENFIKHPEKIDDFLRFSPKYRDGFYKCRIVDFFRANKSAFQENKENDDISDIAVSRPFGVDRLTSLHDLKIILEENVKDEKSKKILNIILDGTVRGKEIQEISKELRDNGVGVGLSFSAVPNTYTSIVKKYLLEKFPKIPTTLIKLREALGYNDSKNETKRNDKEHLKDLVESLVGLLYKYKDESGEDSKKNNKEKLYFIEYYLGIHGFNLEDLNWSKIKAIDRKKREIKDSIEKDLGFSTEFLTEWNRDKFIEIYNSIKNKETSDYEK